MKQHVFSPAGPIEEYRNSCANTVKTQQMFKSTKRTRETKEIQVESTENSNILAG